MKRTLVVALLVGPVLLAISGLAQNANSSQVNTLRDADPIAVARSPYLQPENEFTSANQELAGSRSANENETLAQSSRHQLGPPHGPPTRPSRGSYPVMWSQPSSGDQRVIGALIGFGVGATGGAFLGAYEQKSDANKGGSALFGALLFGGLGAAAGAAIASAPSFPSRHSYRHRQWDDRDYKELCSRRRPHLGKRDMASRSAQREAPAKPADGSPKR